MTQFCQKTMCVRNVGGVCVCLWRVMCGCACLGQGVGRYREPVVGVCLWVSVGICR